MKVFKEKFLEWLDGEIKKEQEQHNPAKITTYRELILNEVKTNLLQVIEEEYAKIVAQKNA